VSEAKDSDFTPPALAATGFSAADRILVSWGCTAQQMQTILNLSSSSYHKFKAHPATVQLSEDQFERVSCLLNIHQSLHSIFSNPVNISGFMNLANNNDYFAGRAPLEIITSGRFCDLYEVSRRIAALKDAL
jgi:hypothetical protein